jgi:hypothetical protein
MAACAACEASSPVLGWLCEECSAAIHGVARLSPEQIVSDCDGAQGALIDRWGRTHPISARTVVGRQLEGRGMAIADASVSRRHAEILRKRDGTWWVVDLVSSNGTTVADELVDAPRPLTSRTSVFFGEVGFFFLTPSPGEPPVPPRFHTTHRPERPPVYQAEDDEEEEDGADDGVHTFSGLRSVDLVLVAPTGGGGGVVELNGRAAQLTMVQYALMQLLADRMTSEEGHDERVRGFVRSSELLAVLPWDTPRPEDTHIKQLVRRVRRTLVRAHLGDLIESRQGFGYRLRVRPRAEV